MRATIFVLFTLLLTSCTPQPISVGFIGGLSGFNSDLGISGRNGALLAIDAINKAGGIRGRTLRLIIRDDKQDPEVARKVFQELTAEKVVAIIGPMTSGIAHALIPLANKVAIPLISPTASSPDFSGLDDYFIRLTTPNTTEAHELARESVTRGALKPCIIDDLSNQSFARPLGDAYTAEYRRLMASQQQNASVVRYPFDPKDETSTATVLRALEQYQPDIVLFTTNSMDTALLAQQIRRRGFTMPYLGTGWAMSQALIENGGQAVEGMIFTVPFNPQSEKPAWREFSALYRETYGKEADFGAGQSWLAVQTLAEGLKRCGSKKLKQSILEKQFEGLQVSIYIDAYGDPIIPFQRLVIQNGELVRMDHE
ncbi:ABC transporter substrate-binding protein [Gracilinema caldarium]|uniref:ABC transporter substrate-binding protein n=1 Tax=Gracilinema caldarium TaxID=215591 RepID=UPI00059D5BF9|nr:ABC transporter substrate-binding protein [Gracilinema caldarium]